MWIQLGQAINNVKLCAILKRDRKMFSFLCVSMKRKRAKLNVTPSIFSLLNEHDSVLYSKNRKIKIDNTIGNIKMSTCDCRIIEFAAEILSLPGRKNR